MREDKHPASPQSAVYPPHGSALHGQWVTFQLYACAHVGSQLGHAHIRPKKIEKWIAIHFSIFFLPCVDARKKKIGFSTTIHFSIFSSGNAPTESGVLEIKTLLLYLMIRGKLLHSDQHLWNRQVPLCPLYPLLTMHRLLTSLA